MKENQEPNEKPIRCLDELYEKLVERSRNEGFSNFEVITVGLSLLIKLFLDLDVKEDDIERCLDSIRVSTKKCKEKRSKYNGEEEKNG